MILLQLQVYNEISTTTWMCFAIWRTSRFPIGHASSTNAYHPLPSHPVAGPSFPLLKPYLSTGFMPTPSSENPTFPFHPQTPVIFSLAMSPYTQITADRDPCYLPVICQHCHLTGLLYCVYRACGWYPSL